MRTVDQLFERYGGYHRHPVNKAIHWVCVPLIVWSVLGMIWAASPVAAYIAIGAAIAFYLWMSPPLALGMLAVIAAMVWTLAMLAQVPVERRRPAFLGAGDEKADFLGCSHQRVSRRCRVGGTRIRGATPARRGTSARPR